MKPDVIVSWPWTCDYPLWRKFIADNRERFAKVLVAFTTNTSGAVDYRSFVRDALGPGVECFDAPTTGEWRDAAVNAALDRSTAEWVWFTEQDFLVHDGERFWAAVDRKAFDYAVGWQEHDERWHPSCMFVRRQAIDETVRYFGPSPVDHFWAFGQEIAYRHGFEDLEVGSTWRARRDEDFEHLQGLSYNHELIDRGQTVTFKPERFRQYLGDCLAAGVPLDPRWAERAQREIGMVTA